MTALLKNALSSLIEVPQALVDDVDDVIRGLVDARLEGLLQRIVLEHLDGGGKRLRARLALAASRAQGGVSPDSIRWAAACELLHNASLIHDDLQDNDRLRRGRPTLWATYGAPQAINAGDALLMLPFELLAETPRGGMLCACLARRAAQTVNGQSLEMTLRVDTPDLWPRYLEMAAGKSGQLFALPLEGASLIAGISRNDAKTIGEASLSVGVIYQILDDVLDLYPPPGDPDHAPLARRGGDVREGKITALIARHLTRHPQRLDETRAFLDASEVSPAQLDAFAALLASDGTLRDVCAHGQTLARDLRRRLSPLAHPNLAQVVNTLSTRLEDALLSLETLAS